MPLYQVAVLLKPTKKEADEGKTEELVVPVTDVLAPDKDAAIREVLVSNAEIIDEPSRVEVVVRPF